MKTETNGLSAASEPQPALLDSRVQLVPIRTESELKELAVLAAADNHIVMGATHLMRRDGKTVGYLSLGGIATVQAWFDSKELGASDSIRMIEQAEAVLRNCQKGQYLVAVAEDSPFAPQMKRLGFTPVCKTVLWHRKL